MGDIAEEIGISQAVRESYKDGRACLFSKICPVIKGGGQCVVFEGQVCRNEDRGFTPKQVEKIIIVPIIR